MLHPLMRRMTYERARESRRERASILRFISWKRFAVFLLVHAVVSRAAHVKRMVYVNISRFRS